MRTVKRLPPRLNNRVRLRLQPLEGRATPAAFTVNSAADGGDANLNDGLALDAAGKTTFRAAIEQGNKLGGNISIAFDPAVFPAGQETTIVVQDDQYTLSANFTIDGAADNTVVLRPVYKNIIGQGIQTFRIMEVAIGSTSTFKYLTLTSANWINGAGGGISNSGTLTVDHCSVTGNSAVNGGGIANSATLTVTHSSISGNNAPQSDGGGIYLAPAQNVTATITDSSIIDNQASKGGGIAIMPLANATLTDVTVYHNNAINGGGIYTDGTLLMQGFSSLTNNSATDGGGIYVSGGTSALIDTTVESNNAANWGGGIWAKNGSATSLLRCTFNNNFASVGGSKIAYTGNNPNIVTIDSCTGVTDADREPIP